MIASPETHEPVPGYAIEVGRPMDLGGTEWLLTNGLGGFAMGSALGMPTRRYHGLLVAALSPPVQREVMLHSLADEVVVSLGSAGEQRTALTPFAFRGAGAVAPPPLARFEKDLSCRWGFRVGRAVVMKEVYLHHGRSAVTVRYEVRAADHAARLVVRPLVAMRDAHALLSASDHVQPHAAGASDQGVTVVRGATRLELHAERAAFGLDPQWWYGFEYARERERGFDCHEDLYSPGVFTVEAPADGKARCSVTAWVGEKPGTPSEDRRARSARAQRYARAALRGVEAPEGAAAEAVRKLTLAAEDFVVRRVECPAIGERGATPAGTTIIAGYPWFTDWGRDAMIALPGLLLCTRRFEEAMSVLSTLACCRRNGLIPNTFDDRTGEPQYNTVDASLWFIHAACEYRRASGDQRGFSEQLRDACLEIVDAYGRGTDFGIGIDDDGLVAAGDATTQLTWMDAKRDGVVFTPRHGKAVEINALWHHALLSLADTLVKDSPGESSLRKLAERCAESFRVRFWNERAQCLCDVLHPTTGGGWEPDRRIRPNQIFAVSLPHSPLPEHQRRAVVQTVRARLLTPHGLRTLDPTDAGYQGRFTGPIFERDAAYHNGTVWPWLMGPFAEAVLRLGRSSAAARADARALLAPLVARLEGESLGQLPEVFDGDDIPGGPQQPGGCPAQAWSVAEVLRVLLLATRETPA